MDGGEARLDVSSSSRDQSVPLKRRRCITSSSRFGQLDKDDLMDMEHDGECVCSSPQKNGSCLPCLGECLQVGQFKSKVTQGICSIDANEKCRQVGESHDYESHEFDNGVESAAVSVDHYPQLQSQPEVQQKRRASSFADTIFEQVKQLEEKSDRLEKELTTARLEIQSLTGQLEEERKTKQKMIQDKAKEFGELNQELEEERKAKENVELKWKKMEKNLFNLYICLRKLIRIDPNDNDIFQPMPDRANRQQGAMNLIQKLLQVMTGRVVEAESREQVGQQEKTQMLQEEVEVTNVGELGQHKSEKKKKKVTFNLTPKRRIFSKTHAIVESAWEDDQFPESSSGITDNHVTMSLSKETENVETVESTPPQPEESNEVTFANKTSEDNQEDSDQVTDDNNASSSNTPIIITNNTDHDHGDQQIDGIENRIAKKIPPMKEIQIVLTRVEDLVGGPFKAGVTQVRGVNLQQMKVETTSASPASSNSRSLHPECLIPDLQTKIETETVVNDLKENKPTVKRRQKREDLNSVKHGLNSRRHGKGFFCYCGRNFMRLNLLRAHVRYFILPCNLPCTVCYKNFRSLSHLKRHMKSVHEITLSKAKIACRQCGIIFSTIWEHRKHWQSDHERPKSARGGRRRPIGFPAPSKPPRKSKPVRFTDVVNLKDVPHGRDHSKKFPDGTLKRHPCLCGMRFSSTGGLCDHVRYYTKEWKYPCDHCGKKFVLPWMVRKHKETNHRLSENACETLTESKPTITLTRPDSPPPTAEPLERPKRIRKTKVRNDGIDEEVLDWMINYDSS